MREISIKRELCKSLITFVIFIPSAFATDCLEPEIVLIPAGPFQFGTTPQERERYLILHNQPSARIIELPTYWIGKYEVTNGEFARFIEDGGYTRHAAWSDEGWRVRRERDWKHPRRWDDRNFNGPKLERLPVCAVSWYEAEAYCRWLSIKTGKPYRLPTSREWEKAARGTDGRIFPWGGDWNPGACNWLGGHEKSYTEKSSLDGHLGLAPVGTYENGKSPYGCYDVAGNVQEWCRDSWIDARKPDEKTPFKNLRGGNFRSSFPRWMRCAWNAGESPDLGQVLWPVNGFRVAMDETDN